MMSALVAELPAVMRAVIASDGKCVIVERALPVPVGAEVCRCSFHLRLLLWLYSPRVNVVLSTDCMQVLVRICYSGINRADTLQRRSDLHILKN